MTVKYNQIDGSPRYNHLENYSIKIHDNRSPGKSRIYWAPGQERNIPNSEFNDLRANLVEEWSIDTLLQFYSKYNISGASYKYPGNTGTYIWPKDNACLRLPRVIRYLIVENFYSHLSSGGSESFPSDTYSKFKPIFNDVESQLDTVQNGSAAIKDDKRKNLYVFDMDKPNSPGGPSYNQRNNRFLGACIPLNEDVPDKFIGADVLNIILMSAIDPAYYWPTACGLSLWNLMKEHDEPFSPATLSYSGFLDFNSGDKALYKNCFPKYRRIQTWLYHHFTIQISGGFPDYYNPDATHFSSQAIFNGNVSGAKSFASELDDFGVKYKGQLNDSGELIGDIKAHFGIT